MKNIHQEHAIKNINPKNVSDSKVSVSIKRVYATIRSMNNAVRKQ